VISSMDKQCIWIHHGGSGRFLRTIMNCGPTDSPVAVEDQMDHIDVTETAGGVDRDKIIKIETRRSVIFVKGFVVGGGFCDIVSNESNRPLQVGDAAGAALCKVCNQDASKFHFSPCGHCVFCKKCWDELAAKPTACELCQIAIEQTVEAKDCSLENDQGMCPICMDAGVDTLIVPCGHTVCLECAKTWFAETSSCPFCREPSCKYRRFVCYR
jgi:hypothetical protein